MNRLLHDLIDEKNPYFQGIVQDLKMDYVSKSSVVQRKLCEAKVTSDIKIPCYEKSTE